MEVFAQARPGVAPPLTMCPGMPPSCSVGLLQILWKRNFLRHPKEQSWRNFIIIIILILLIIIITRVSTNNGTLTMDSTSMRSNPTAPATPMYTHMLSDSPSLPDCPKVELSADGGVFNPPPAEGVEKMKDLGLMEFI